MLIDMASLPQALQAQILTIKPNEVVQFTQDGQVVMEFCSKGKQDSFVVAAGLLKRYGVDGVDYERQMRGEWEKSD